MLIKVAAAMPKVIPAAKVFLAALYQKGYRRAGQKTRKKKSAPKRVATKTQKTIVRHYAAMRSLLWTATASVRASILSC